MCSHELWGGRHYANIPAELVKLFDLAQHLYCVHKEADFMGIDTEIICTGGISPEIES